MGKASFVLGYVGPKCSLNVRKVWNAFLVEEGSLGMLDFYRTRDTKELELRLSEMFVLQRRGYIVDQTFEHDIVVLLDKLDTSAQKAGKVDTVLNNAGVLIGYFFGCPSDGMMRERLLLWNSEEAVAEYVT